MNDLSDIMRILAQAGVSFEYSDHAPRQRIVIDTARGPLFSLPDVEVEPPEDDERCHSIGFEFNDEGGLIGIGIGHWEEEEEEDEEEDK